jgi:hypothetical protein
MAVAIAACGSDPKPPPKPDDIAAIGSSVGDIVYQCQSVEAGFIAEPDDGQLRRDVKVLLTAADRVDPDAEYKAGAAPGPTRRTSVRGELRLARRILKKCDPALAKRLDAGVEG